MKKNITDPLLAFNKIYKKMDETYHLYAKKCGISNMELWLFYSLYENNTSYTQKDFCAEWHYAPQTVNSTLKSLEKRGIIEFSAVPGNRKIKRIILTKNGVELIKKFIVPLVCAEQKAFQAMDEAEQENLLSLTGKYAGCLKNEIDKI